MTNRIGLDQIPRIEPQELKRKLDRGEDVVLVDVRKPEAYEAGHIPGALAVPLSDIVRQLDEIPRDKEVVLY